MLSFIPHWLIPETVSTGIIFVFTHMYTLFTPYLSSYSFPCYLPSPTSATPPPHPRQNLFCPSVLRFCRRKYIKDKKRSIAFLLI
jgi:hypothetical protein